MRRGGCAVMGKRDKAPDGESWPIPWVAVDTAEQRPWTFGTHGLNHDDRTMVGSRVPDPSSLVTALLNGPFATVRANLHTADYWLLGPDADGVVGPVDGWVAIERKERDLVGSLSADRVRFMAEMERLSAFKYPCIIASTPVHDVTGGRNGRSGVPVQSLIGTLLSIATDYRIQVWMMPNRSEAEYAAAWVLRRTWRRWLVEDESGKRLARVRELEKEGREESAESVSEPAPEAPSQLIVEPVAPALDSEAPEFCPARAGRANVNRSAPFPASPLSVDCLSCGQKMGKRCNEVDTTPVNWDRVADGFAEMRAEAQRVKLEPLGGMTADFGDYQRRKRASKAAG